MKTLHFKTRALARQATITINKGLASQGINKATMKAARTKDQGLWDSKLVFTGGTLSLNKESAQAK